MAIKNVTTAGTRVQLTTTSTKCARVTLQLRPSMTGIIYVGYVGGPNTGASVSSSAYDCFLNTANPSVTFGMGETIGNSTDPSRIWLDSSVNGEGVAWFVEGI